MQLPPVLLFSSAATIAALRIPTVSAPQRVTTWRHASLQDAVGVVYAEEGGCERVATQQWLAITVSMVVGISFLLIQPTLPYAFGIAVVGAGSWQLPLLFARTREKNRQLRIDMQLNDALGELVMGVEAGMTLESVMNAHAQRRHTDLAHEFKHVLTRINVGVTRGDALDEMLQRTPTTGMKMFAAAVQQNQRLGTPLAEVLRQQAQSSRRRRRQNAEESAAILSLKMIFPTVFCILPVLLIVVVGPAIVRLVHTLP